MVDVIWTDLRGEGEGAVEGTTLRKVSGYDDTPSVSGRTQPITGASMEFTIPDTELDLVVGLSINPEIVPNNSDFSHAFSFTANGAVEVREYGVYKTDFVRNANAECKIEIGDVVRYWVGGELRWTSDTTAPRPSTGKAVILDINACVTNMRVDAAVGVEPPFPIDPPVEPPVEPVEPPVEPPVGGMITTAEQLVAALAAGGSYEIAAGLYVGNFVVDKPTTLVGHGDAVLRPLDLFEPTLLVLSGEVHVEGLQIENGYADRECVVVGLFDATDAGQQPDGVVLDTLNVIAGSNGGHRGIALHGKNLTVRNCRVTNFWEAGRDSQAIWIHNGPGPYTIEDNYLEASGEVILTGGAEISIPDCVPSDIVIRRNTCFKPDAWRSNGATVKNSIELKNARRALIEDNRIDGNWCGGQTGIPIVLTVRNQEGQSPWAIVDEVIVRGNETVRCCDAAAVSILGSDDLQSSQQTRSITVEHNLFSDSPSGFLIGNGVADPLVIRNNTMPAVTGTFLKFYDTRSDEGPAAVVTPLTFVENIQKTGEYGITGTGTPCGTSTVDNYTTIVEWTGNVTEMTDQREISMPNPGENHVLPAGGLAQVLDPATFKLLPGTPYGNAGY